MGWPTHDFFMLREFVGDGDFSGSLTSVTFVRESPNDFEHIPGLNLVDFWE